MMRPKYIWFLIAAGLIFIIFLSRSGEQSDNKVAYEIVNFCGTEYQAPIIIIDGVDMIKRIAEAASAEANQETCQQIVGANKHKLKVDYSKNYSFYSISLNGYLFEYEIGRTMIVRPGEHGVEGWMPLRP